MTNTIGPYRIVRELARGGMGVVYEALDPRLGRPVALKLLHADKPIDDKALERFRRETLTLAQFRHPNVVRVHDAGAESGKPYFVQDLVEGESYDRILQGHGPVEPESAARTILSLAGALEAAHEQGILHRDLKPANVIRTPSGHPVLIDFGIAKNTALALSKSGLTKTGQGLGSPGYWSPEQACGERERIGPASDVYGLGATLYALLTGQPPFGGAGMAGNLMLTINEPARPPSEKNPQVPEDLNAICLRCLEKEPEDRYPSAQALGNDLARFLAGEPVEGLPGGGAQGRRRRRRRVGAVSFAAGALMLVAAPFVLTAPESSGADADGVALNTPQPEDDGVAPILSVTQPPYSVQRGGSFRLSGRVTDDSPTRVICGDVSATAKPDGAFQLDVPLAPGVNQLELRAVDAAGRESKNLRLTALRLESTKERTRTLDMQASASPGLFRITGEGLRLGPRDRLIVPAGSTLEFSRQASILCEGELWVLGTAEEPVTFRGLDGGDDWEGLEIRGPRALAAFSNVLISDVQPFMMKAGSFTAGPDSQRRGGAITVLDGARLFLLDTEVRNGRSWVVGSGGGLFVEGNPSARSEIHGFRTSFEGCQARRGGAVYVGAHSVAELIDCQFIGNRSTAYGGGIAGEGQRTSSLKLGRVAFLGNVCDRRGGATSFELDVDLRECRFERNQAKEGADAYVRAKARIQGSLEIAGLDNARVVIEPE